MRTLANSQNITVDGSIEFLDGWFDPTDQDDELVAEINRQSADEEVLLLNATHLDRALKSGLISRAVNVTSRR